MAISLHDTLDVMSIPSAPPLPPRPPVPQRPKQTAPPPVRRQRYFIVGIANNHVLIEQGATGERRWIPGDGHVDNQAEAFYDADPTFKPEDKK